MEQPEHGLRGHGRQETPGPRAGRGAPDSRRKQASWMTKDEQGVPGRQKGKMFKKVDTYTSELASKCVWSFTQNL